VDLGIGQPGVIIDRGVDEPMTLERVAVAACPPAGTVGLAVAGTGGAAQEPVATPGRDVAQLLDIDLDQLAGMVVLVAADRLAAGPVKMGQATDAAADQTACTVEGASPTWGAIWAGPSRWVQRRRAIFRTTGAGVRRGLWWGRLDRSAIATAPRSRWRVAHRCAVGRLTWNRSAARATDQPWSTMARASRSRPSSLKGALR
jgi:hypothetical protein